MGERFDQGAFQVWLKNLADGYGRMMGRQRVAIKSVVFNQMDFEFALLLDQILDKFNVDYSNTWYPKEDRYLSLGNYEPPVLDTQLDLVDPAPADDDDDIPLPMKLLRSYKTLLEDYLQDPRLQHWKFLPQLHVLLYSNQSGV
jgi:hypothetical protein